MSSLAALLNKMASTSGSPYLNTRKRARQSDTDTTSPSKRQARGQDVVEVAVPSKLKPVVVQVNRNRKSATHLPQVSLRSLSSPAKPRARNADMFEVPDSPEDARRKPRLDAQNSKVQVKKKLRRLGQKKTTNTSPLKNTGFGNLNELQSGAVLTSHDTPARNTRAVRNKPREGIKSSSNLIETATRKNPLERLVSISLHPAKTAYDRDLEDDNEDEPNHQVEKNGNSYVPSQSTSYVEAGEEDRAVEDEDIASEDLQDSSKDSARDSEDGESSYAAPSQVTEANEQTQVQPGSLRVERRIQKSPRNERSKPRSIAGTAKDPPGENHGVEGQGSVDAEPISAHEPVKDMESNDQSLDESEDAEEEEGETQEPAPAPPSKAGRSRPAMSQDEKQARREAEARQRQENMLETEAAELADFDRRSKEFLAGLEHVADQVGGHEALASMGGGARTITAKVARKTELITRRAQSVWRKIRDLQEWCKDGRKVSHEEFAQTMDTYKMRATSKFLHKDGNAKGGDPTAVELFEHLIPHSVYLLGHALRRRFIPDHKHSWQEISLITNAAINLCDTATRWDPKPSVLEGGIRQEVRRNIRPALGSVQEAIEAHLSFVEHKERHKRKAVDLERAQAESKAKRQRQWEAMQVKMSSRPPSSIHVNGSTGVGQSNVVVHDDGIEEDFSVEESERHALAEIPAPDPIVIWTDEEEIALLNGLQRYTDDDRYIHILESCPQLAEKDVDECMTRARYYKRSCGTMLRGMAAKGNHSYEWLSSV